MLRQGAGDLLTYLAARSVRLGVIAGPQTTPGEFESFVKQLRQQSIRVAAAVSPEAMTLNGAAAGVDRAGRELGVARGGGEGGEGTGGRGAEVLVVGSSEALLRAATAAEMFTARYRPPNSRPEGVIQNFTVRDIDEVKRSEAKQSRKKRSNIGRQIPCVETGVLSCLLVGIPWFFIFVGSFKAAATCSARLCMYRSGPLAPDWRQQIQQKVPTEPSQRPATFMYRLARHALPTCGSHQEFTCSA